MQLEHLLNEFNASTRRAALEQLLRAAPTPAPLRGIANMHCHTFFSFNAYGYSPTGLAWLARQQGIDLMGIVDFDVLDAVTEFLDACDSAEVRGSAGIETRVFVPEFARREINSPGEPGVLYHMAIGFTSTTVTPAAQAIIDELRAQSAARNQALIARVNAYLDPVQIDYAADVLPLTPSGNATERHIVVAYIEAAKRTFDQPAAFWASRLGMDTAAIEKALGDSASFQNTVRSKLMKRGGPGYVQPDAGAFPRVERLHELAMLCRALPCAAWLDGMSEGEQAMDELLTLLVNKGVVALNIVPDRNWNLPDPQMAAIKQKKLYEVVALAKEFDLPLNVGTEMNGFGQPIVDDFAAPALAPVRNDFMDGAYFIYGHTLLERHLGMGYQSDWAAAHLPTRAMRNAFYTTVGRRTPPGRAGAPALARLQSAMTPDDVLRCLV
ncbi:MAG TPA: hypothetical protein DCL15_13015 [Chloroflexi bacterium]|nr:hypothetical protein [Chloroflexota bacterium]